MKPPTRSLHPRPDSLPSTGTPPSVIGRLALALGLVLVLCSLAGVFRSSSSQAEGPALWLKVPLAEQAALQEADLASPYRIVQFEGPILPAWREALGASGATIVDYLPDYAYVVRLPEASLAALPDLPGVHRVARYPSAIKLLPELAAERPETGPLDLIVQLFAGEDPRPVADQIIAWGGTVRSIRVTEFATYLRAQLPVELLPYLAALPAVSWVERYYPPQLENNIARRYDVMAVDPVWSALGLYGQGQIVGVADTGLDTGNLNTLHPDLRGRVLRGYGLGRPGNWSDPHGHGTHVAGSVAGNGVRSGSNPGAHDYQNSFAGVAPEARLVFQSGYVDDENPLGGLPDHYFDLFGPPYQDGVRVHSNSWSHPTGGPSNPHGGYDAEARETDEFVWSHRDLTVLFAASNNGTDSNGDGVVDPDSINSPGTAKNVITVGASENYRPGVKVNKTWGSTWPDDYPSPPISDDHMADDMAGMAAFSGRGPTDDGRIKPDLVAPGTEIISLRSRASDSEGWGVYNNDYLYMGGTSMATPLAAGSAAVVRQAYTQRLGLNNPSAALIKATLIHGARPLWPGQYGIGPAEEVPPQHPNIVAGWGRLNLRDALFPLAPRSILFLDQTRGLQTGQAQIFVRQVTVPSGGYGAALDTPSAALRLAPLNLLTPWVALIPSDAATVPASGSCAQIVTDGSFEEDGSWSLSGRTEWSETSHSGAYSAWLGDVNSTQDRVWQTLYIPPNTTDAEVSFWIYQTSEETYSGYDSFWAGLYSADWNATYCDLTRRDGVAVTDGWELVTHRLTTEELEDVRGRQIHLVFQVKTDHSAPSSVRVDDVRFDVCVAGERLRPGPLRATLVWSDYPGALAAAKALVNDLDLEVIDPAGRRYYGNGGAAPDRLNPVEDVLLADPVPGVYRIIVRGYNVPWGPQPYALLISLDEPLYAQTHGLYLPLLQP